MANYSIKDIEHLSGIKAHTIRMWEKRYNILEPRRTETNIRYYNDEDLKKILNISVLNRYGYKISRIADLPNERLNRETLQVAQSAGNANGQIESLIVAMVDFDEVKFDKVFNNAVLSSGFEETMVKLIYPFFEKIGILWQTGNINPAQEHFVSNLIRQKLIVAIDNLVEYPNQKAKNFILFLPDGEWHELGLLFYTYFIKKSGHHVIYLGSSLPLADAVSLEKHINFDFIVTSIKTTLSNPAYNDYLKVISKAFTSKKIFLMGVNREKLNLTPPSNFILPLNLLEFKSQLVKI
jgi:DNA-binding transcriptional MerR regulator